MQHAHVTMCVEVRTHALISILAFLLVWIWVSLPLTAAYSKLFDLWISGDAPFSASYLTLVAFELQMYTAITDRPWYSLDSDYLKSDSSHAYTTNILPTGLSFHILYLFLISCFHISIRKILFSDKALWKIHTFRELCRPSCSQFYNIARHDLVLLIFSPSPP